MARNSKSSASASAKQGATTPNQHSRKEDAVMEVAASKVNVEATNEVNTASTTPNKEEVHMTTQCIALTPKGVQCKSKPKQYKSFNSIFCGPHENIVTSGATINTIDGLFSADQEPLASVVVSSVCVAITTTGKEVTMNVPSTASAVASAVAKSKQKDEAGVERFFADEVPGHFLLEDMGFGRVEFIFIDLKIISAKAVDGHLSPLDVIIKDFAPTWGNVRSGFYRGVRVGNMAWGTLPFDIEASIVEFVDDDGEVKATSLGKVLKYNSLFFAPSGAHLVIDKAGDVKIGIIEEIMPITKLNPMWVDGAMIFSKKLWKQMIENSIAAIALDDPFYDERVARLNEATCAIVRVVTPTGTHKGLAIKAKKNLGGHDIISSNENFKKNIKSLDGKVYFWAEPHVPHTDDVAVDPGSMMAMPFFFQEKDMLADQDYMFRKLTNKVYKGNISPVRGHMENDGILSYQQRFNKAIAAGLTIFDAPALFQAFSNGIYLSAAQDRRWKLDNLEDELTFPRYDKMRWALRGSVRLQVVSSTWAKIAGLIKFKDVIADGAVRIMDGMAIVSDVTFATNYNVHGGWDLDDKMILVAFEDTMDGTTKLFGYRQPCSWGEYAIYTIDPASNMDEVPKAFRKLDSSTFPIIDVAAEMAAKVEKKKVTGRGWVLPSAFYDSRPVATLPLTQDMLAEEALRTVDNPLGAYVKIIGVFYAMMKAVPCAQLGTHESVVDAMTQASAAMDFDMVKKATENILAQLIHETGGQIDEGLIGRITQKEKFVKKNNIDAVDGKFIRMGRHFKRHLSAFKARNEYLYNLHMGVLMSKAPPLCQEGRTIGWHAAPLKKHYMATFKATPKSVTKLVKREGRLIFEERYSYADLQNISNTVADCVDYINDDDMLFTIAGYLNTYDRADKNMSNGRMLDRYLKFLCLINGVVAAE